MDFDWEKEFSKIRIEVVNNKFNQKYDNFTCQSDTKLQFPEKIIVVIFDECKGVEYLPKIIFP